MAVNDNSDEDKAQRSLQSFMRLSHVGIQFTLSFGLLLYAGIWVDGRWGSHWGSNPVFTLLGLAAGFGIGFFNLYRTVYAKHDAPPK